ncbi:hypothetical protein ABZS86_36290 [Streptomyces sp. NPDC005355]|uniref:hypothetical protein n=1 Tax=Streptomyces sp. NPDC005355 TaxID=3157038 RepID=UPI0033B8D9C7
MIEQAARLVGPCGDCDRPREGWAVQLVMEGRPRWELELACDDCGVSHDGDWDAAPDEVRRPILAEHGYRRLRVEGQISSGGKILRAFRNAFGASIGEAKQSAKEFAEEEG